MARDEINEWDILKFVFKILAGLGILTAFAYKSKKAKEKIRNQFLLGAVYDKIDERTKKEIANNEDWFFKLCWKFFNGLSVGWASIVSAFTSLFLLWIIISIVGEIVGQGIASLLTLVNWGLAIYIGISYHKKFKHYQSFTPESLEGLKAEDLGLGTPDGQPTQELLDSHDPEKDLILGQISKIPLSERKTHLYVIGRIGSGKSKAAEWWFTQDAIEGRGCAVMDPHGDLADNCLASIANYLHEKGVPLEKLEDQPMVKKIRIIDPTDKEWAIGYNPLQKVDGVEPYTQAKQLEDTFKKVWKFEESEAPVMSEILRNASYTLIENNKTLLEATLLLTDKATRNEWVNKIDNPEMKVFWEKRFNRWIEEKQTNKIESSANKIAAFTSDPLIRPMIGQVKSTIKFRDSMDEGHILIFKLPKGKLGSATNLLGAFFIASMHLAAMSREDIPERERKPFYVYVDEFQNFTSANFSEILREDRKYGLHYTLINQDLGSVDEDVVKAIWGNVMGTVAFQVGDTLDAQMVASRFFHLTGKFVKTAEPEVRMLPGLSIPITRDNVEYHTVDAESKLRAEEFRMLPPRVFAVKYSGMQKPIVDITVKIKHPPVDEEPIKSYVQKIKEIVNRRNAKKKEEIREEIENRLHRLPKPEAQKGFPKDMTK